MDALLKALWTGQGWFSRILIAWTIFGIGYMAYWFALGGDPDAARFQKQCWSRGMQAYSSYDSIPEQVRYDIFRRCDEALRNWRLARP